MSESLVHDEGDFPELVASPIPAAVFLKPGTCVIGVPLIGHAPRFVHDGRSVWAEVPCGQRQVCRMLTWPNEAAQHAVRQHLEIGQGSVFVVEFSDSGLALTEHTVHAQAQAPAQTSAQIIAGTRPVGDPIPAQH